MKKTLLLVGLAGMVFGILGWGAFNMALEATNDMGFCVSCHEMRDTVFVEYQASPHFQNPSGVRATCPDCHVPRDWTHKLARKIQASGELFHWAIGSIDSAEKFEAKRHTLARREWDRMRANDSRECRNCHSFEAMAFHKQSIRAARSMRDAAQNGKTCIDCHKAIAHKMPDVTATHRRQFAALSDSVRQSPPPKPGTTATTLAPLALGPEAGGAADAEINPGMAVQVLAIEGDRARVGIDGWRRDGTDTVIYARQGKRIAVAGLTDAALSRVHSGQAAEDAQTGQIWTQAGLEGWVPLAGLMADPRPLWDYAEQIYRDNCTLCHVRHDPGKYTADTWIGQVNSMKRMTPLSEQEAATLLAYLQSLAK